MLTSGLSAAAAAPSKQALSKRSPSSRRSALRRRDAWLAWKADEQSTVPTDKVWLLHRLSRAAACGTGVFGKFVSTFAPRQNNGRQRDVFPLAPVVGCDHKPASLSTQRWKVLLKFINTVVAALNWLYGVKLTASAPSKHTACQRSVVAHIVTRAVATLERLQSVQDGAWQRFLPDFVTGHGPPQTSSFQDLVADRVDNLVVAARCDPLPHLPPEVQVSLAEASSIVQAAAGDDLAAFEGFSRGARLEYAQLVVKQLRCGKLGLSTTCKGGGTTFAVSKPGGERLREVWHGKRVSEAAQSPPKPRHLASPTALSFLECTHEQPLRLSKRDASCWFDQLKLPVGLRQYMAKPPLSSDELACAGMPVEEQKQHIEPGQTWERGQLFPLHHVWPMGFSWSSFIAQEEMLNICQEAGLPEDVLMACDSTTPQSFKLVGAVATDDVMFFSNAGPGVTSQAARAFDEVMQARGAVRNVKKDVNDQLCGTCVGVDLVNGVSLDVPAARYMAMIVAFLHLQICGTASGRCNGSTCW